MDTNTTPWAELSQRLSQALHLSAPPIAISFSSSAPDGVPAFDAPLSEPTTDGRQGRVSAGCVFWIKATTATFTTSPIDHGNCSVGSLTHGLADLEQVAGNDDVATLLGSGWVDHDAVMSIPFVSTPPNAITYGPLADTVPGVTPDVVLIRVNGRQLMVIRDAIPDMKIEGKPQCHIIAVAKETNKPAASVGCALSRARTGMTPDEMTCALPAANLPTIIDAICAAAETDSSVAKYAAADARRFSSAHL